MKHSRAAILLLALLLWVHTAFAQIVPLQLQVIKVNKQVANPRASYSAYDNTLIRTTDDILTSYAIKLSRAMTPLTDVHVRWVILVQQQNPSRMKLVQGEGVCNVPPWDTVTLQTQPIRTGVFIHSQNTGLGQTDSFTTHPTATIKGYEVEVYVNGQRVIADIKPPEVQQEIEAAKTRTKARPRTSSTTNAP
jgi:hypothetical protein